MIIVIHFNCIIEFIVTNNKCFVNKIVIIHLLLLVVVVVLVLVTLVLLLSS